LKGNKILGDQEILDLLMNGDDQSSNIGFKAIYQLIFPDIKRMLLKQGATDEVIMDVFQETVMAFYFNLKNGRFKKESKLKTYLYAIAKNQWHSFLRKNKQFIEQTSLDQNLFAVANDEDFRELKVIKTIEGLLLELDKGCQKILRLYYFDNCRMKEIMRVFDLSSEQSAKTKKYRCLKKLEKLVQLNRINKDSFTH